MASAASAQRPPAVVPARADAVLERLPRGYAQLMPARANAPLPQAQIERLLATAARSGDARLVARAEAALARWPAADDTPAVLRARAYAAQYRHDFPASLALLARLVQRDPRDGDARLMRAQVWLVQGRLDAARAECATLALSVDAAGGLLCAAALAHRRDDAARAAQLLDRWLQQAGPRDPSRRHALVMRAEAAAEVDSVNTDVADAWFRRALAAASDDVRTLAAYSRHLRETRRPREAHALLVDTADSDHLLLERALAAHAARLDTAPALIESLARRYRLARAAGSEPDLRDEAEFELTLRGDAAAALPLAQRNFASQRDREDVALLRRASHAANRPEALQPLHAWARAQRLDLRPLPAEVR
ncbi:tetratricopeptide repeat protein [Lysobacter koreensis]|uniref:Tetratricopeptide repeat protein n=1 Tax=Lysobacter koreensis TaxID=266122 RepID=A0ABW2YK26_9GAMM